jgi:hypothetical protein
MQHFSFLSESRSVAVDVKGTARLHLKGQLFDKHVERGTAKLSSHKQLHKIVTFRQKWQLERTVETAHPPQKMQTARLQLTVLTKPTQLRQENKNKTKHHLAEEGVAFVVQFDKCKNFQQQCSVISARCSKMRSKRNSSLLRNDKRGRKNIFFDIRYFASHMLQLLSDLWSKDLRNREQ